MKRNTQKKRALRSKKQAWALVVKWIPWITKYTASQYRKAISRFTSALFNQEYNDTLQLAYLHSLRAAELFDKKKGFAFPTYVRYWIDRYVFKNFISERFCDGKLLKFYEYNIDEDDLGVNEFETIETINRKELSKSIVANKIKDNKLLSELFVKDKTLAQVGKDINHSRELIRLRRNEAIKRIKVNQEKFAI